LGNHSHSLNKRQNTRKQTQRVYRETILSKGVEKRLTLEGKDNGPEATLKGKRLQTNSETIPQPTDLKRKNNKRSKGDGYS